MDLGRKINDSGLAAPKSPKLKKKVSYPSLSLSDDVADAFLKDFDPKLTDTLVAKIKFKVTELSLNDYGNRVGFDVLEMNNITPKVKGVEVFD